MKEYHSSVSSTSKKFRQYEFAVSQRLCAGAAPICRANSNINKFISSMVKIHFTFQYSRYIKVNVLFHGLSSVGVCSKLDNRFDWIPNNVTLACREQVHSKTCCGLQSYTFCSGR